jgi:hypothetical protein
MKNFTITYWDRFLKQTSTTYVKATCESEAIILGSSKSRMVLKIDKTQD